MYRSSLSHCITILMMHLMAEEKKPQEVSFPPSTFRSCRLSRPSLRLIYLIAFSAVSAVCFKSSISPFAFPSILLLYA